MDPLRATLLAASQNPWLRERAMRSRGVRRAVSRFMPGETLEAALAAAGDLKSEGLGTILTHLGENVSDRPEAEAVTRHYVEVLDRIRAAGLDAEVSVKLSQLGLEIGGDLAARGLAEIARHAAPYGIRVWIDMEDSATTERTIEIFRTARSAHENLGLCLQAYLRRTPADLEALLPLQPAIRLVKGAYREPERIAFPRKTDVDSAFFVLAARLLEGAARGDHPPPVLASHDPKLIARILDHARTRDFGPGAFEFALLYGIQREQQRRLARAGFRVRVLISYGASWFPWYMRRLAERPANLLFVLRNAFGG